MFKLLVLVLLVAITSSVNAANYRVVGDVALRTHSSIDGQDIVLLQSRYDLAAKNPIDCASLISVLNSANITFLRSSYEISNTYTVSNLTCIEQ